MTQRVALVTGAMGGLGTAICQELAKAGHKVVASYHPQFDNKDAWLADMAAAGFNDFVCVAGDVSVLEDCQKMVAEAEAACGQVRLARWDMDRSIGGYCGSIARCGIGMIAVSGAAWTGRGGPKGMRTSRPI